MSAEEMVADAGPPPARGGRRWLLIGSVLLLAGGGLAGAWFSGLLGPPAGPAVQEAAPPLAPPVYYTLDSNLVVNFRGPGRARYLQVGIELVTRDPKLVPVLQTHAPAIRNALIMLLSDQSFESLESREGKEVLQAAALAEVQAVLQALHGKPSVESLYFTTFVMQ